MAQQGGVTPNEPIKIVKASCRYCCGVRNHRVLADVAIAWSDQDISGNDNYQVIQCLGCDVHAFRQVSVTSEDFDGEDYTPTITIYPPLPERAGLEDLRLPYNLSVLYREVIDSFNAGHYLLCAAGIRGLVEGLCVDLGVDRGPVTDAAGVVHMRKNLEGQINGLHAQGHAGKREIEALQGLRFMGNEAVHELDAPTQSEIRLALDIVEHILVLVYAIEEKTAHLQHLRKRRRKTATP